jgi:hypothetical protein
LEKENPEGAGKIKWVCFTSSHGTFAAYQPFGKFRAQIAIGNVAYAKLLNQEQTPAFYALIEHHRKEEGKLKNGLPADANTIPGLEIGMLPDLPLINREVLVLLQNYKWNEAMLVTPRERKPIGMVTLHKLIHDTMGFELLSPHAEEALKKKIKSWEKDSGVTVAALEKPDNRPAPPADHGDDSPELDAMVPFGANKRTRSALLRFTPP